MSDPPTIPEILAMLRQAIERDFPGFNPRTVVIRGADRRDKMQMPLPYTAPVASRIAQEEPAREGQPFVPNVFQRRILTALDGKALKLAALGAVVMDRPRLTKPHGLQELIEQGLVEQHPRLGYYRPDALPAELQEGESNDE